MTAELSARPRCAVCGHAVESFTEEVDRFAPRVRYVARCHGDTQIVNLPTEGPEAVRGSLEFGEAFAPLRQLGP
jgi:hypothetical protein